MGGQPNRGLRNWIREAMDDLGRKNLKTWLQKSLANHPENDNGLVAYVEAIVGDAEGTVRFLVTLMVFIPCSSRASSFGACARNS